jgi:hypothetical protein
MYCIASQNDTVLSLWLGTNDKTGTVEMLLHWRDWIKSHFIRYIALPMFPNSHSYPSQPPHVKDSFYTPTPENH